MPVKERKRNPVRDMLLNFMGIFGSRASGLLRDIAMSHYWGGSGSAQAAFHLAFSIPNLFRTLFGEGAFTAAFLPAVAGKLEKNDREGAWRLAERTISLQILVLAAAVLLASAASVAISLFLGAGARPHIRMTFRILPLLMPYALLVCVTGSFASILNSLRIFALPSLNPVIFNVTQVAAVVALYFTLPNDNPLALYLFCGSVILAGIMQASALAFACRRQGFVFHFRPVWSDPDVKAVARKFLPGTLGAGVNQVNQLLDKIMVGWLGQLAISGIEYSHRLIYLPVGLFGVAVSNVCLTDMSRASAVKDSRALSESLDKALRITMFLSIPCAVLMGVLAETFVRFLFHHGAFDSSAVESCTYAMSFYVLGIPAMCCSKVAIAPHHANLDTVTPVRVSMCCVLLNFLLNISLIFPLKHGGLALSTSICSWVNVIALLWLGRKYAVYWKPWRTVLSGLVMLLASIAGGFAAWLALRLVPAVQGLPPSLDAGLRLLAGGAAGYAVFLAICLALCHRELREMLAAFRRKGRASA